MLFVLFGAVISSTVKAQVGESTNGFLAQIFQDDMVIQRGTKCTFWGNAQAGKFIRVYTDWGAKGETVAENDGRWKLRVDVPDVSSGDFTPHEIIVKCDNDSVTLSNVLIGDVWFFSGQSNMSMSMQPFLPYHKGAIDYKNEIAAAVYPNIRLYKNSKFFSRIPQDSTNGHWCPCSPESVAKFSAVAYYMAKKLYQEINIPIGVIVSALGGMACQAFTPAEVLQNNEELDAAFWQPYLCNPKMSEYFRPSLLYNGMIHPFVNLSIKGFVWYQGESNAGHIKLYPLLCSKMIESWRKAFSQGDLPFYFVQMTPYSWKKKDYYGGTYAEFREAQESILNICDNTDMVSTMDVGDVNSIHPSNKKVVGERLAWLALHHNYNFAGTYKGPVFKEMKIKRNKVIVRFEKYSVGKGLNTSDGEAPKHFYLAGEDKVFYPADAVIKGNTVVLKCDKVDNPIAVRYAFLTYPITNFENKEGFAAYPFRTDNWSDATYYQK